eukprot:scaffold43478_cov52-Attheya_sp.AAC.1
MPASSRDGSRQMDMPSRSRTQQKSTEILLAEVAQNQKEKKASEKKAVAFYASDENYFCAATYVAQANRNYWNLTGVDYTISLNFDLQSPLAAMMKTDEFSFIRLKHQENVRESKGNAYYRYSRNKFDVFRWTEYDAVVFVDSDSFPLRSFENLFVVPPDVDFAAPQSYYEPDNCFTSALFFTRPSNHSFEALVNKSIELDKPDMDVIVNHYMHRLPEANGMYFAKRMLQWPYFYFCLTYSKEENKTWGPHKRYQFTFPGVLCDGSYVMHFSKGGKPWTNTNFQWLPAEIRAVYEHIHQYVIACRSGKAVFDASEYERLRKALGRKH